MERNYYTYTPPEHRDQKGDDKYLSAYRKACIAMWSGGESVNLTLAEMRNGGSTAVEDAARDLGMPQPEVRSAVPKVEKTIGRAKVTAFCGVTVLALGISLKAVLMFNAFLGHPLAKKEAAAEYNGEITNDYDSGYVTDIEQIADTACDQERLLPVNSYQKAESTYTITQNLKKASLIEAGATVIVGENVSVDELYVCGASTEVIVDGSVDILGVLGAGAEVTVSGAAEHVAVIGASTTLNIEGSAYAAMIRGGNASATVSGILENEIIHEYIESPFSIEGDGIINYTKKIAA